MACYPVCHLLPTFVHHAFLFTPPVPPPTRIPLVGFPPTPPVAPPPPIPLDTGHGGCAVLSTQLCLILVPPHHEPFGCFEEHRSAVSTPNTKGARSADPSVTRNSLRSSTMLCQVLNRPPGPGFSPPANVPNITRQGNRSRDIGRVCPCGIHDALGRAITFFAEYHCDTPVLLLVYTWYDA